MDQFEGCIGVDGAKSGWLAVWWQPAALGYRLFPDAMSLVEAHRAARVIAVDIPIGLPERGGRRADIEARKFVGGRRASSVFSSPVRGILDATCQPEASHRKNGVRFIFRPGPEWPRLSDA